jgi:type II secretory pathway component PulF
MPTFRVHFHDAAGQPSFADIEAPNADAARERARRAGVVIDKVKVLKASLQAGQPAE